MEGRKALILSTLAAALALFSSAVVYENFRPQPSLQLEGIFPSIGKKSAPIEIVLIEDFQCRNCRIFSQKIIPKIEAEYIRSGQVRFILVPVSFLRGSQRIGNAALEVYDQNPERFFPYLREILRREGEVGQGELVDLARKVGGIDLAKLERCIQKGCHNERLQKNLTWAQGLMGGRFRTPALYINGSPGSTFSFEAIQDQIDQVLGEK